MSNAILDKPSAISVVCAIKNRTDVLRYTIPTWLSQEEVGQLILVDWDSDQPLIESLNEADIPGWPDPRTQIIRVVDQPFWKMGRAINLAMSYVQYPLTFKVDADVAIVDFLTAKMPERGKSFVTGKCFGKRYLNRGKLFGSLLFFNEDFFAVNGYDERFESYGFEDNDLYDRLQCLGRENLHFNWNQLFHLPHSNVKRQEHQEVKYDSPWLAIQASGRMVNSRERWTPRHQRTKFQIVQSFSNAKYQIVKALPVP